MPSSINDLGDGVFRLTQPLPWALDHVHCYLIREDGGWTAIDTGLGTPATLAAWQEALDGLGKPPLRRLIVTHYHPDHVGAGRELVQMTGVREVVQGRLDADLSRRAWEEPDDGSFAAYLIANGMPDGDAHASARAEGRLAVHPPRPTRLVDHGDAVELAGERCAVQVLPGHADGHIVLAGERSGRVFGGDVLLAEITPNVGRWPDTAADPLGSYLRSLAELERLAPAVVHPGHGPAVRDVPGRVAEIREHHRERLDAHLAALHAGASSAYAVAQIVWADDGLGFHEQRFALVEAVSHLERLEGEGRARQADNGGWQPA
jgi:glyoxylase-like metal-dependent hydrolase (beta-lactamase superfamily II)